MGRARAVLAALQHLRNVVGGSGEQGLDAAVAAIAHPACQPQPAGDALGPVAVAHALHTALDAHPHGAPIALRFTYAVLSIAQRHAILARIGGADQHPVLAVHDDDLPFTPRHASPRHAMAEPL